MLLKRFLIFLGQQLSEKNIWNLYITLNYILLGNWYKRNNFFPHLKLPTRDDIFQRICLDIEQTKISSICYLEFGVKFGDSLRFFANQLKSKNNLFYGFDSFEGLPEDWDPVGFYMAGSLSTEGALPNINDSRINYIKGYFNETLPKFNYQQLSLFELRFFMIDSDLYSSAVSIFNNMGSSIKLGDYIYMDNMSRVEHEPKALIEYVTSFNRKLDLIYTDMSMRAALFKVIN